MPEYLVDEFIDGTSVEYTLEDQIDKKVSLLYDLCMLCKRRKGVDKREEAVRELLASYQNETQMDNAVHDIIVGNCTLEELLKRKGYM
jgi:hypothetical protein